MYSERVYDVIIHDATVSYERVCLVVFDLFVAHNTTATLALSTAHAFESAERA